MGRSEVNNPLRAGLDLALQPEPAMLVIFGGTGDLTKRKLMPSLYQLESRGTLPPGFAIVGLASHERGREQYQEMVRGALDQFLSEPVNEEVWRRFADRLYYVACPFDDPSGYAELGKLLTRLSNDLRIPCNAIFYLSSPPSFFGTIVKNIEASGLADDGGWRRIVIEKPFGSDLRSAVELNKLIAGIFPESQTFRVDHYLGKDTVQNILVFRFANAVFEPVWNRRYIDHIELTASETVGIEGRAEYYEEAGALRDMVQNHMLQMIALVAMEPPVTFDADDIRNEKAKLYRAIRRYDQSEVGRYVVRGQYGRGVIGGRTVPEYREEPGVSPTSDTETYVAARLLVDNWRWQDVPFYIRTGKALARKKTEIAVHFKPVPHGFFGPFEHSQPKPDVLVIRIQPNEGISLRIETKVPGPDNLLRSADLDFSYLYNLGVIPTESYERILLGCMLGDQTLFARRDGVESQWEVVQPFIEAWNASPPPPFPNYKAGTWGPRAADDLIEGEGRRWRRL